MRVSGLDAAEREALVVPASDRVDSLSNVFRRKRSG